MSCLCQKPRTVWGSQVIFPSSYRSVSLGARLLTNSSHLAPPSVVQDEMWVAVPVCTSCLSSEPPVDPVINMRIGSNSEGSHTPRAIRRLSFQSFDYLILYPAGTANFSGGTFAFSSNFTALVRLRIVELEMSIIRQTWSHPAYTVLSVEDPTM